MPWDTHHQQSQQQQQQPQQQQLDYYMNVPAGAYANVNLINSVPTVESKHSPLAAGALQTVPTSTAKSRSAAKHSSSPSTDFSSSSAPPHKEIYAWMSDKKHGANKSKSSAKNHSGHNTTSTSSSSSSSGKRVRRATVRRLSRAQVRNVHGSGDVSRSTRMRNDLIAEQRQSGDAMRWPGVSLARSLSIEFICIFRQRAEI